MKLNKEINIDELRSAYGFSKLDEQYKQENNIDEGHILYYFTGYVYNMGHSRRGQFYYLVCSDDRNFGIIASKPDGGGGLLPITDDNNIFWVLIKNNVVELIEN